MACLSEEVIGQLVYQWRSLNAILDNEFHYWSVCVLNTKHAVVRAILIRAVIDKVDIVLTKLTERPVVRSTWVLELTNPWRDWLNIVIVSAPRRDASVALDAALSHLETIKSLSRDVHDTQLEIPSP